ncbi:MAG: carbohydrate kinase [Bacteroidetes bacterium]|nr:carbohydrate kinase [Bacteroidota bacterium]
MDAKENVYDVVCYGEILWDVLPEDIVPGGAPMNITYHLKKLGLNPALITKIGHDDDGKRLIHLMERNEIPIDFFQMDFELDTGRVNAIAGENNEVYYDIRKPVAWDNIAWSDAFEELLANAKYFVFGSLITRNNESRNTLYELLKLAKYKVLDINLRSPHYTRKIIEKLMSDVDLLKLNLGELELVTGWFSDYKNENERIKMLQEKFRIPNIVLTKGEAGSIFYSDGKFYAHPGFKVELEDTIGSGDAFLAGLISKLSKGASPSDALEFASAMGALIASYTGSCPEYDIGEIQNIIKK